MSMFGRIGAYSLRKGRSLRHLAALAATALWLAVLPSSWTRPVQAVLVKQVYFTGVQAVWFIAGFAFVIGLAVVSQAQFWMVRLGQSELLGPFLVTVILRELGPLLVAILLAGRSGSAMTAQIGVMRVTEEIDAMITMGMT